MKTGTVAGLVLLAACLGLGVWRWKTAELLRIEIAGRTARPTARAPGRLPVPPTSDTQVQMARNELDHLRARVEALLRAATSQPEPRPSNLANQPANLAYQSPSQLRDAGRAEPQAALQTVLWSAAGGDVDRLEAHLLAFEPGTLAAGQALFARLSPTQQASYRTPLRLLTVLAADEMTFANLRVVEETRRTENEVELAVVFRALTGPQKGASLVLRRFADGWRLVVPEAAAARYAAQLGSPPLAGAP